MSTGPLAVDGRGNALVAFHRARTSAQSYAPLPLALGHGPAVLLVRSAARDCWELPGGMIEPGEHPRQAAQRELHEETGHQLDTGDLILAGHAEFTLTHPNRGEYAAVFTATSTPLDHYPSGDEITDARWWDTRQPPPQPAQILDITLARLARDLG